jgi:hypothetical protein
MKKSLVIFIEQNLHPHMEQKWATLAPSDGKVSSWKDMAIIGSNDKANRSIHKNSNLALLNASSQAQAYG